jgi:RNA polymerase sigma-70 factor (ECF subfamily)
MARPSRFEELAVPHLDAAFSLAHWLVRNHADAEDIVQEAYLRAFRGFSGFSGGNIKPWLLTIVRNVAYRRLGDRKRVGNVISFDEAYHAAPDGEPGINRQPDEAPDPEMALISASESQRVLAALGEVHPTFREAIVLREIEGLSYREIAEVIGAPIGTVMSRLSRGRAQLAAVLGAPTRKEA